MRIWMPAASMRIQSKRLQRKGRMRDQEFLKYLVRYYRGKISGKPLGSAAAGDARSRCRRAERVLRTDLDAALATTTFEELAVEITKHKTLFEIRGNQAKGICDVVRAVRLYAIFYRKKPLSTPQF